MIYDIQIICFDPKFRTLCKKSYYNHPKGCPNYGKKKGCPPKQKMFDKVFDGCFYLIYTCFNLKKHVEKMRKLHPKWTNRQLYCCLYWQGTARKNLRKEIEKFNQLRPGHYVTTCPEAMGINVTQLMEVNAGVKLEWPPKHYAYQVAMGGLLK